ncbi:hypothetical protein PIB30_023464 [Stylosanthes scabra]|uniref:Aminotransferase-like plant mobile domain-containing protein n=1 Tax=Stylosanthes scabra TaxID=79078 RepID=A0ABU6R9P2_9FABA|nr:hypothetical protein [Stylosanthes scabra]
MFGELPESNDRDACTVTFSWLKSRYGELPRGASAELVVRHARAYIWMLLSTSLFGDKTAARAHESVPSSQQECRPSGKAVGSAAELDFLAVSDPSTLRFRRHRVAIGLQVSPHIRREGPRLQAHRRQLDLMPFREFVCLPYQAQAVEAILDRCILQEDHRALWSSIVPLIYFRTIEWHQVDQVIPQFRGVQNRPHAALNINFMHAKNGRGNDQWFPQTFAQLFDVAQSADPGPTADFLQWWILAARRYLVPANLFHCLPPDEIPVEAMLRQSAPHPARPDVPHVPDNRRLGRRMMVRTRTTARDWQWLDEMMVEDAPAERSTQKIRRMPESYARQRGAGRAGRGRDEGGDTAPTQQTQGGASTS